MVDPTGFDELGAITVTCCSSSGGGGGGIFGAIGSFFGGLFGGGGSHLSASQQAAQAHGVNLSKSLPSITSGFGQSFINTPGVQPAAADYFGADPNNFELNAGSAAATLGTDEIDGITVTGHTFYGTNLAPLFVGIGQYNPLHAGVQTLQVGINGAFVGRGILSLASLARGFFTAGSAVAGAGSAQNVANGVRLAQQLTVQQAGSLSTATGELTPEAIANSRLIMQPEELLNDQIPSGFAKYTTDPLPSPYGGEFTTRFYMNPSTGEVFYGLDYKSLFLP